MLQAPEKGFAIPPLSDIKMKYIIENSPKSQTVTIGRDENLTYIFFNDPAAAGPCRLEFVLKGSDSSVKVLGFDIGNGKRETEIRLVQADRETCGQAWIKTISAGEGQSSVKGLIVIEKSARGANAKFTHNALLLSDRTRVFSWPALEIKNDEVKASHAATVGRLDRQIIFYLNSRGLGRQEAAKLVVSSFAKDLLKEVEDGKVRSEVEGILEEKLATLGLEAWSNDKSEVSSQEKTNDD